MRYSQLSSNHPRSLDVYENQSIQSFFEIHQYLQNMPPCLVVAGTNGKGSVCRILQAIYSSQGYRVGSFITPHLLDFKERIQINGSAISTTYFDSVYKELTPFFEQFKRHYGRPMTFFEMILTVAVKVFESCDMAIIEVGLGGARDATRVFEPHMNLFTSISLDHCHILGDSVEAIRKEKLGILKSNAKVITIPSQQICLSANCMPKVICSNPVTNIYNQSFDLDCAIGSGRVSTSLLGAYQLQNIQLALQAVIEWQSHFKVEWEQLKRALQVVSNPCRLEWIHPRVLIDGSHNEAGIQQLLAYVTEVGIKADLQWALSIKKTKDIAYLSELIGPGALFFCPKSSTFFSESFLANSLEGQSCNSFRSVLERWISGGKKTLLVTGSLVGSARFKRRCLKILDSIEKKTGGKYSAQAF